MSYKEYRNLLWYESYGREAMKPSQILGIFILVVVGLTILFNIIFTIQNQMLIIHNSGCISLGNDVIFNENEELRYNYCICLRESYDLGNTMIRRAWFKMTPYTESDVQGLKDAYQRSCNIR
jgi:hypothetical protein